MSYIQLECDVELQLRLENIVKKGVESEANSITLYGVDNTLKPLFHGSYLSRIGELGNG